MGRGPSRLGTAGQGSARSPGWNGAAYARGMDPADRDVYGGGHTDYFGQISMLDLASREWRRITDGYVSGRDDEYGAGALYPDSVYPDGSPLPPHTYDYVQYDPRGNDYILFKGQTELGPNVKAIAIPHLFNLDTRHGGTVRGIQPRSECGRGTTCTRTPRGLGTLGRWRGSNAHRLQPGCDTGMARSGAGPIAPEQRPGRQSQRDVDRSKERHHVVSVLRTTRCMTLVQPIGPRDERPNPRDSDRVATVRGHEYAPTLPVSSISRRWTGDRIHHRRRVRATFRRALVEKWSWDRATHGRPTRPTPTRRPGRAAGEPFATSAGFE